MTVAALLFVLGAGAWLVTRVLTRIADRLARRACEAHSAADGVAIDVTPLRPRIQTVRADFAAQSSWRKQESPYHEQLMESARQAVSKMAFFQSHPQANPSAEDRFATM
jgi:hypothetical protein